MQKFLSPIFGLLVLAFLFAGFVSEADAQKKKKKKGKAVAGSVVKVEIKDGEGTLTVKTNAKKKKGKVVAEGKEYTFKLTKDTKVETRGKKKGDPATPGSVSDIREGMRVRVMTAPGNQDSAQAVQIFPGRKKKKN